MQQRDHTRKQEQNSLVTVAHAIATSASLELFVLRRWRFQASSTLRNWDIRYLEFLRITQKAKKIC